MFTGIIETRGRVAASEAQAFGRRLVIDAGDWRGRSGQLELGASIAVNGVCLTIASLDAGQLHFDVIAETLAASTLGDVKVGDAVNLESALLASTPVGGHFVQGHVDGVGRISAVRGGEGGHEWVLAVRPPVELMDYLPLKGSVAIEGVSLTVAAVTSDSFEVALIPTTLEQTTLSMLQPGHRVNLETDMVVRAVVHWLRRQGNESTPRGISWQTLRDAGFVDDQR